MGAISHGSDPKGKSAAPRGDEGSGDKAARLARALRENLHRRKSQARERRADTSRRDGEIAEGDGSG